MQNANKTGTIETANVLKKMQDRSNPNQRTQNPNLNQIAISIKRLQKWKK